MTIDENEKGRPPAEDGPNDERRLAATSRPTIRRHPYAAAAERERSIGRAAFEEGYRLGFTAGRDVGYQQAETDMQRAWTPVAEPVRNLPRQMTANARRYPGYTAARLAELRARARDRFGLPSRDG